MAGALVGLAADASPVVILVSVLVLTMTLSDILNNAATAVVMAPISVAIAAKLHCCPGVWPFRREPCSSSSPGRSSGNTPQGRRASGNLLPDAPIHRDDDAGYDARLKRREVLVAHSAAGGVWKGPVTS